MAINTTPTFGKSPQTEWSSAVTSANTATDGTGTVNDIITAGADGTSGIKITLKPLGTNVPTKCMIFINNGSTNTSATNNSLIKELSLPATTASNTTALAEFSVEIPNGLPGGYKIFFVIATAVAGGWKATAETMSLTA